MISKDYKCIKEKLSNDLPENFKSEIIKKSNKIKASLMNSSHLEKDE